MALPKVLRVFVIFEDVQACWVEEVAFPSTAAEDIVAAVPSDVAEEIAERDHQRLIVAAVGNDQEVASSLLLAYAASFAFDAASPSLVALAPIAVQKFDSRL